jgi:hypothetical protein
MLIITDFLISITSYSFFPLFINFLSSTVSDSTFSEILPLLGNTAAATTTTTTTTAPTANLLLLPLKQSETNVVIYNNT